MNILLAPHNDDEALFASYICMRYKPLVVVVTDSFIQYERGQHEITAHRRRDETREACKVLGVTPRFRGLADTWLDSSILYSALVCVYGIDDIFTCTDEPDGFLFVPALQGGNTWHDEVNICGREANFYDSIVIEYATYAKDEWYTPLVDGVELVPTDEEFELKKQALACYESQSFQPHFPAVLKARSEWVSRLP